MKNFNVLYSNFLIFQLRWTHFTRYSYVSISMFCTLQWKQIILTHPYINRFQQNLFPLRMFPLSLNFILLLDNYGYNPKQLRPSIQSGLDLRWNPIHHSNFPTPFPNARYACTAKKWEMHFFKAHVAYSRCSSILHWKPTAPFSFPLFLSSL